MRCNVKKKTAAQFAKEDAERLKQFRIEQSMRNHRRGTHHELSGTHYVVMPNGAWLRVTKKPHEKKEVFQAHLEAARTKFPSAKVGA